MAKAPRSYQLSSALVASSVGAGVVCLAPAGMGRTYRLHASRPGPERNRQIVRHGADAVTADLPSGAAHVIEPVAPLLTRVDISGPLEQRAGYHDPCGGWSDGHDAIAERLCAAFASGDVLLVVDSPGGAAAGLQQAAARALKAKLHHGRRVVVWADEMIGSAAEWWTSVLGDELYLPEAGQVGSIGARSGHESIAGLLEKEGRAVTYFTWPNDGKIAFAPELPLGEVGKARGARDVAIAGEAFCAAVCAGPVGLRYKLDRDGVIALGADMLTGANAVGLLADGVATLEEVTAYALSLAELGPVKSAGKDSAREARARGKGNMAIRAEENEEARARVEDDDKGPPSSQPEGAPSSREAAGREIPTKCGAPGCGVENDKDAKFCKGCGASMSTGAADGPPVESAEDPPASDPVPPKPGASSRGLTTSASFEEILGLPRGASVPAQKAAALGWRTVVAKASAMTGQTDADRIVGGLIAVEKDAAAAGRLRAERNKLREDGEARDRMSLAHRLVAAGEPRGRVFVDTVSEDGKRQTGGTKLTAAIAEMRIGTLRGMVEGLETRKPPRNPFEPSKAEAIARSNAARGCEADKDARVEAAKALPAVRKLAQQSGRDLAVVAAEWVNVESGAAAIGGVQ